MSFAPVIFDDALNASASLGVGPGIDYRQPASVACELDAREKPKGLRVVQCLSECVDLARAQERSPKPYIQGPGYNPSALYTSDHHKVPAFLGLQVRYLMSAFSMMNIRRRQQSDLSKHSQDFS